MAIKAHAAVPDVPADVKQAILASIKASNAPSADDPKGGRHEEGGIWGLTSAGKLVVIPAKPGKAQLECGKTVSIYPGDAANPDLDKDLATIIGEWHIHPSGIINSPDGKTYCDFVQPPSKQDLSAAFDDINIVVGASDKKVYFYNYKETTNIISLKDFLK
jgi:hypothetical protein